jgi:anhydro-N-acetylmuramic acid kinase
MARKSRIVLGLNSGTSADGVDAVACEIVGRGLGMKVKVLGHVQRPYSAALRDRLLAVMAPAPTRTEELCRLETEVGEEFADVAATVVKRLGLKRVDLIGSHGQTICHLPPDYHRLIAGPTSRHRLRVGATSRNRPRFDGTRVVGTLQIGDASIIAARLRCPVVHHFRQADMAVGGQGAPLVPWTDHVLFRHPNKSRVVQNIGGISNVTYLPAGSGPDNIIAFDIGPGNMVLDALARRLTHDKERFDRNGRRARIGKIRAPLLDALTCHPFLERLPPKSCGREEFGVAWVDRLLSKFKSRRWPLADWLRTGCAFFGTCCMIAYCLFPGQHDLFPFQEIILCGGGVNNPALVFEIQALMVVNESRGRPVDVLRTDDFGIPVQTKEGVSFAMLAAACVDRVPANLPQVTGARKHVVLGQICDIGGNS